MNNPADIIVELNSDNSRLFKEGVVIREMQNDNTIFFKGVNCALNSFVTFGVKAVPEKEEIKETNDLSYEEFFSLLVKFENRELTGNAAKSVINDMMSKSSTYMWNNFYRLVLIKDLRCGVSAKTINNCVDKTNKEEFRIPEFGFQKAHNADDNPKKLIGEKLVDVKLDGVRIITVVNPNGNVDMYTKNGKSVTNFSDIIQQFKGVAHQLSEPMVFDGEITKSSFQNLMTMFFRKKEDDTFSTKDSVLNLFDMLPFKDFVTGICKTPQLERRNSLMEWDKRTKLENVTAIDYVLLNFSDSKDLDKFEQIKKEAAVNGYEGVMIKDVNAPYVCKRSSTWLKKKPVISVDLTIIGVEEGSGKYEGMTGALVCSGVDSGKEISVNVGSGLSDELREEYWKHRDELVGRIVEIEADAITQNQNGGYSLRFPRFKCLRSFEDGEKL